jgi:hypothetical protein
MKTAIMQPYFWPYIGYFQMIGAVDSFIVYDDIQYTKSGWINRNRLCRDGAAVTFSLPLKSASGCPDVRERELADDFNREKLLNQIKGAYGRAPYFAQTLPLIETVVRHPEKNLFRFLLHSLLKTTERIGISTRILISSDIDIDHGLKGQERVLALCEAVDTTTYVNLSGGVALYSADAFRARGMRLQFIRTTPFEYAQLRQPFIANLSIIDVLMFNSLESIRSVLCSNYELFET